jgi:single-stranded-DNA-specific exonuclease
MKYKLIKPINPSYSALEQVLTNRGIKYEELSHYIHTTDDDINSYELLGKDKILNAIKLLITCINNAEDVVVVIDADCDGYTSSALLINYLTELFPSWTKEHIKWLMHEGKQHGLSDCCQDVIDHGFNLCIVPDAGRQLLPVYTFTTNQ